MSTRGAFKEWLPSHARGAAKRADSNRWGKLLCGPLLLLTGVLMLGCTTVVTPLQPGYLPSMMKSSHGLVLGRMHLVWNGREQRTGARFPLHVRLRITEEKSGAQVVIDRVPVDGPFVLDLPAASYRLTVVSLHNSLGVWQTSLPATFSVWPQECTYLGTWKLQMQTEFFSGSMTRQVFDQRDLAARDLHAIIGYDQAPPPLVAQLATPKQGSLVLTFQTEGTQLTSPP
ncbi:MAG: hypothetical protein AB7F94_02600 [Nitrospira sp.]